MNPNVQLSEERRLLKQRRHQRWAKIVSLLACVVVFITTYALILPAITLEKDTAAEELAAAEAIAQQSAAETSEPTSTPEPETTPEPTAAKQAAVDTDEGVYALEIPEDTFIWLSDVLAEQESTLDTNALSEVVFDDAELVEVEPVEDDYRLTRRAAFDAAQTLSMTDEAGGVHLLSVTNDANEDQIHYWTDLAELLKDLQLYVDGELVENDSTVDVRDGMLYDLVLTFQEKGADQFSNTEQMYFDLPAGFVLPDDYAEKLTVNLGLDGKVYGNLLSYDKEHNRLLLDWNQLDRKYHRMIAAGNLRLSIRVQGEIIPGEVHYGDILKFTANRYDPQNATVTKSGVLNYDDLEHQFITYTVKVISDGSNQNLTLTDALGSALTYQDGIQWHRENLMESQSERATEDAPVGTAADGDAPYITKQSDGSFAISIPEMHDGDVLTFTYNADVDYTKIRSSGNATFAETGNTAEIFGDSDPIDNKSIYHQKEVYYSDIAKDNSGPGKRYTDGDREYQDVTWTIDTNKYKMISFRGTDITDFLTEYDGEGKAEQDKTPQKYKGDGITIKVYEWNADKSDRVLVETRKIPWSELSVSDDLDPKKGWTYHVPQDDGIYEYEISYVTQADVTGLKEDVMLRNDAVSRGGEDRSTTLLHPKGKGLSIQKNAIKTNKLETTWEIIVTLNDIEDGFNDLLVLTERLPTKWASELPRQPYRDTYKPGTLEIYGLQDDESYIVYYSEYDTNSGNGNVDWGYRNTHRYWDGKTDENGNKIYPIDDGGRNTMYIYFYQDPDHQTDGLRAPEDGGDSRTLRIRLTTYNNQELIDDAYNAKGVTSDYLLKHQNDANINLLHELAEISVTGETLYKKLQGPSQWGWGWINGISDNDSNIGYRFETYVSGVYPGDQIVIDDLFDTDLFMLAPAKNNYVTFRAGIAPHYASLAKWSIGEYDSTVEQTETGVRFTIGELPLKSDGTAYPFYGVEYHLLPKNQAALEKLQQMALEQGGIAEFVNTAKYKDRTDSDVYHVELAPKFKPVVKSDPQSTSRQDTVEYTILLNQQKQRLNDGEPITMEDEFKNLSIDYSTIKIQTEPAGRENQVSYDYSGSIGTYIIPDETKVTITYQAKVLKPAETEWDGKEADVTVYNVASMLGWSDGGEKTIKVKKDAGGDIYRIRAFKYGSGHMEAGLNGAVFGLYTKDADGNYIPMKYLLGDHSGENITFTTQTVQMLDGVIQDAEDLAKLDDEERARLVTRSGYADVQLNQATDGVYLDNTQTYYLLELEAPEGYVKDDIYYSFTFSEDPNYSDGAWQYYNNDILKVRNSPEKGSFRFQKAFDGNYELTDSQLDAFTFTVQKQSGDAWQDIVTGLTWAQVRDGYTVENLSAGTYRIIEADGGAIPKNVAHKLAFTVDEVEDDLTDGEIHFTLTSEDIADGLTHSLAITNTYNRETTTLYAGKRWVDAEGVARMPEGAEVKLAVYLVGSDMPLQTVTLDGTPDTTFKNVSGESAAWMAQFSGLPKKDADGNLLAYMVKEISGPDGYDVIYSETLPSLPAVEPSAESKTAPYITNRQETVSYTVEKTWTKLDGTHDAPEDAAITLGVYYGATEAEAAAKLAEGARPYKTVTLPQNGGWTAQFENLPKADGSGAEYVYLLAETQGYPGYRLVTEAEKDYLILSGEAAITAENTEQSTDFTFSKAWRVNGVNAAWPQDIDSITVTLYDDSGAVETYTLTASDAQPTGSSGYACAVIHDETKQVCTYTISGLPTAKDGQELRYYVCEIGQPPGDYTVHYGIWDNANQRVATKITDSADRARDGEYILNDIVSYELPATGGCGTTLFAAVGLTLLGGGLLYGFGMRRKRERGYTR